MAKNTALQKITTEAKKLRKQNPRLPWISAVRAASKAYNAVKKNSGKTKVAGTKKRPATKKTVVRASVPKKAVASVTISGLTNEEQKLQKSIEGLKLEKKNARYVKDKREIQSRISGKNKELKALGAYLKTKRPKK